MRTSTGTQTSRCPGIADPSHARACLAPESATAAGAGIAHLTMLLALASLPLAGAVAGALYDEHDHLGFTNWRSACRATGLSLRSALTFSLQLLPTAIAGLLAGGLALQLIGFTLRNRGQANTCLAAHAGCALTMPIGMALCAQSLPLPMMIAADVLLAAAAAWTVQRFFIRIPTYSHRRLSVFERIPAR